MLAVALDYTERRIDAQMVLRLNTEARATRVFGTCITCTILTVGACIFAASRATAMYITMTGVIASLQLFAAAMCAFLASMPRLTNLPGRFPSDIWQRVTDNELTSNQFIKSLLDDNKQFISENDAYQTMLDKALWLSSIMAVSTPVTSLASYFALKML